MTSSDNELLIPLHVKYIQDLGKVGLSSARYDLVLTLYYRARMISHTT